MIFNRWRYFTGERTIRKSCYNKKIEYFLLDKKLKAQTDIAKYQYKFLKDQKDNVVDNNREDYGNREENKSITKEFDAILKDIKDNKKTTKSISVNKSHDNNINWHPLIINLINTGKTMLKKDYRFDEAFNISGKIDNKHNKLNKN